MESILISMFNSQKKSLIEEALNMDSNSLEYKLKSIEIENYNLLDGYISYLYNYYLLLTDKEAYAKEHGLESTDDESLKKHYIENFEKHNNVFNNHFIPIREKIIYNYLQSSKRESFIKQIEYLKDLINAKNNAKITVDLNLPSICGLEFFIGKQNYSISELEAIIDRLEDAVNYLKYIYKIFETYSPVTYMNMRKDSNISIVEKVFIEVNNFDIMGNEKFNRIKRWVNINYPLYKKLKFKSKFSKKSKKDLYELTYTFIYISKELFSIIENYIINIYKKLLPKLNKSISDEIDVLYLNKNYENMKREIIDFINRINEQLKLVDTAKEGINYKRDSVDLTISKELASISEKYSIDFTSDSDILSFDPYEIYSKVHLAMLVKKLDRMVTDNIINTYGKLSDEVVYRLIPLK